MLKNKMRRLLSILMAMGLLFSSGITAIAANSIPVGGGEAAYSADGNGELNLAESSEGEIELVFLGNGGTPDIQTIQIATGVRFAEAFEKITIPTREYKYEFMGMEFVEEYTFIGWFTTPTGEGVQIHATDYIPKYPDTLYQDTLEIPLTLYARWRAPYLPDVMLIFGGNGGTPEYQGICYTQVSGATFSEVFVMIEEPTKPGHTFLGWYAGGMWDIDGNYITFPIYATQAVFSGFFYAQWLTDEPKPGVVPPPVLQVANGTEGDNWGTFNVLENVRDVYRYRLYFSFPTQELAEHNLRSFEMIFHGPSLVETRQVGDAPDVVIRTVNGDINVSEYFYTGWFCGDNPYAPYSGFGGVIATKSALNNPNFYGEWAELYIELYVRKVDLSGTELYPVEYLLMTAHIHVRGEYANGEEFFVSSNNVYTHYGIPYKLEETWSIEANNFVIHVNEIENMDIIELSGATASLHIEEVPRLDFDPIATPFVLQDVAIPADNPIGKHGPVVLAIEEQLSRETTMEIYFFVISDVSPTSEDYVVIKDCRYLEEYFSKRAGITPEFIKESLNVIAYRIDDATEVTAEIKFNEADLAAVGNATKAGEFIVRYSLSTGDAIGISEEEGLVRITLLEDEIGETELHIEWFYAFNFVVHVDDLEDMDVIALSNPFVTLMPIEDGIYFGGTSIPGTPIVLEMIALPTEDLLGKHGPIVIGIEEDVVNPITREIYFFVVDDDTTVSGDYVIYKNHIDKEFANRGLLTPELIVELSEMVAYGVICGENVTELVQFNVADIAAVTNATVAGDFAINYTISSIESLITPLLTFPAPVPGEGVVSITLADENGGDCETCDCEAGECDCDEGETCDCEAGECDCNECETCDCEAGDCDCDDCEACDCEAGDCDCDDCEACDCDDGTPGGGGGGANQANPPPLPGGGGGSPSPRTGDDNNIIFFSIVLVLATIAGTAAVAMKKKQNIKREK